MAVATGQLLHHKTEAKERPIDAAQDVCEVMLQKIMLLSGSSVDKLLDLLLHPGASLRHIVNYSGYNRL